ncbi:P-loop NTPase [Candidatus Pacearchaeota archaeon]|nr:P-loop NTPase [Candidatus Pacearchaeota archaeon]
MGKIIVITSGKGGTGKTTTAINLGAAIRHFNKDVLLIDGNLTTPNVGVYFGSPEVPVTFNHVLSAKALIEEAVYEHESGMKIILSSLSIKELKKLKFEKMKDLKKDLKKVADFIIVDSAAGLGNEALSAVDLADELIIVTNPELPAITDALKMIKLAEERRKKVSGVIITKVRGDEIEMQPDSVKEMLETPIIGMVPYDFNILKAMNLKNAVVYTHPKSNSSRAYKEIAAKMLNEKYDSEKDKEKLLVRILQKLRLSK